MDRLLVLGFGLAVVGCSLSLDLDENAQARLDAGAIEGDGAPRPDGGVRDADAPPLDSTLDGTWTDAAGDASDAAPRADAAGPDDCEPGWHDGGDGRCVPAGSCVPGYALRYRDGDGDGVGVGEARCVAPDALGWADVADDCDDGDAAAWRLGAGYVDGDGDSFTVRLPTACVGDPPPNLRAARPPPRYGLEASRVAAPNPENGQDGWSDLEDVRTAEEGQAKCRNRRGEGCGPLVVTGFTLGLPPEAQVRGVVVHVVRRADGNDAEEMLADDVVQLTLEGGRLSDPRAGDQPWGDEWTQASYGAPDDTWGQALTVAALSDPDFGVWLHPRGEAEDLQVRHVWIEVYLDGGDDCDDESADRWSPLAGFVDQDGDGWGAGPTTACAGPELPVEFSQRPGDCYDGNQAAHPENAPARGSDRGDGSFDYDCDGLETPVGLNTAESCAALDPISCRANLMPVVPAPCGEVNTLHRCMVVAERCTRVEFEQATSCR